MAGFPCFSNISDHNCTSLEKNKKQGNVRSLSGKYGVRIRWSFSLWLSFQSRYVQYRIVLICVPFYNIMHGRVNNRVRYFCHVRNNSYSCYKWIFFFWNFTLCVHIIQLITFRLKYDCYIIILGGFLSLNTLIKVMLMKLNDNVYQRNRTLRWLVSWRKLDY